jgi:hypothetical protein
MELKISDRAVFVISIVALLGVGMFFTFAGFSIFALGATYLQVLLLAGIYWKLNDLSKRMKIEIQKIEKEIMR